MSDHCTFPVYDAVTGELRFCHRSPNRQRLPGLVLCEQHAADVIGIVHEHDDVLKRKSDKRELARRTRQERKVESTRAVYYIQRPDGAIKIGSSTNPEFRKRQLESTIRPLVLLAQHLGGFDIEADVHLRFNEHRLDGEWFAPHADLLAHIARLKKRRVA